jgi:putative ABC transport system permease protein
MTRFALALIELATPTADREWVLGDIVEELRRIEQIAGQRAARWWLMRETLRVVATAWRHRLAVRSRRRHVFVPRGESPMSAIRNDFTYALRLLKRSPGHAAIAIVTLAIGIGATSAVFSLVQGVLLTPPPYEEAGRIALVKGARADGQPGPALRWSAAQWMEWQRESKSFDAVAGYAWAFNFLVSDEGSESLEGMFVSKDFFKVLGVKPLLGRTFQDSEVTFPPATAIILGYELWQRKFGGDPKVLGTTIRISRRQAPSTVIAVMPPGIRFLPSPGAAREPNYNVNALVDFWAPLAPNQERLKAPTWDVVGRLRAGTTLDQADSELKILTARQAQADNDFAGITAQAQALTADFNRDAGRILLPLLGAAALVLLIACGNVAALLLVRGLQRQDEYAIRTALGVKRFALFRQVSIESLVIALLGSAGGAALAFGIIKVFKVIAGPAIPRLDAVTAVWPVLISGLGLAIVGALVAGFLPAFRASRLDAMQVIKSAGPKSSAGRGDRRLLRAVTVGQTALTLALLVGAGLLLRTTSNLSRVQSGYNVEQVLTMTVTAVQGDWNNFHTLALDRVAALSGVTRAAFAWGVPLTGNSWPQRIEIEGQPPVMRPSDAVLLPVRAVTPGYFDILGIPIFEGRDFRSSDATVNKAPRVAIVNRAFADRYFQGGGAMGKKIWQSGRQQAPFEIVGVIANSRTDDLTRAPEPELYLSLWQSSAFSKDLVVRTTTDPRVLMTAIQTALRSVDPTVAIENVRTLEQVRDNSVATRTFAMQLLVGFAMVASVLTLVGVYGVLSLSIASRRREIAVRSAVGAQQRDIRKLVFADAFRLIAAGIIAGILAAVILSRGLTSFLFEVEATDVPTLAGVGLLFASVALLACWVPTRRAARINPLEALRGD